MRAAWEYPMGPREFRLQYYCALRFALEPPGKFRWRHGFPEGSTARRAARNDSYSSPGSMMAAKEFLARFSLLFTVPRLQPVISAISSYDLPSSSRSTKTCR